MKEKNKTQFNIKKSQAALEFIMVYGWIIIAFLIAIWALDHFGIITPIKLLPSTCEFQFGIACLDQKANESSLEVKMHNTLGYEITIIELRANHCTARTGLSITIPSKQGYTANLICSNSGIARYKGQFNITYTAPQDIGNLSHSNIGRIATRVE